MWRLPLHPGYRPLLESPIADLDNAPSGGLAGAITAALFLERFVTETKSWAHLDIYGWNLADRPGRPKGGEATALRALLTAIERRFARLSGTTMERPQPTSRADYRVFHDIPTRWLDNDVYGHVNNVNYYSFFDTAIAHLLMGEGGLDPWQSPVIGYCVESGCRFHVATRFPDRITAGLARRPSRPHQCHLPRSASSATMTRPRPPTATSSTSSSTAPPNAQLRSRPGFATPSPAWWTEPPPASHHRSVALGDDGQDLVGVALPPVVAGEDLDLDQAVVAGRLDQAADVGDVDHAVAHHAAIEQQILGRHQPVADMEAENAGGARALDLALELGVPPDVVDVDRDPEPALAVRDRARSQRSSAWPRVLTQQRSAVYIGCSGSIASATPAARASGRIAARPSAHLGAGDPPGPWTLAACRPRPGPGRQRRSPPPRRSPAGRRRSRPGGLRSESAGNIPARQRPLTRRPCVAEAAGAGLDPHRLQRLAPGRDGRDAVAGAALDRLAQIPSLAHRRPVQRQVVEAARKIAHLFPLLRRAVRPEVSGPDAVNRHDMAHARDRQLGIAQQPGGIGEPEQLGQMERRAGALWPPTMVKWSWWPLRYAMRTTPVL